MEIEDVRRFALTLPGTTEEPHFELQSFRVGRKLFATWPSDGLRMHIFLDEAQTYAAVASAPAWTEELWWGKRLVGVRILLDGPSPGDVRALLVAAWCRKAPRRVVAVFGQSHPADVNPLR